jgi:type II secretory pathway pseudopilin PulG
MVRRDCRHGVDAYTLLEIAIVLVVIAILAILIIPVISKLRERAQRAQCAANLRSLYLAANLHLQQNGSWPQIRLAGADEASQQDYANAWINALSPFGPERKTWICPTMQDKEQTDYTKPENARIDYLAMPFDDKPMTPHQWENVPWFAETGDLHGNGNLMVFPDGSIRDLTTIVQKASSPPK